MFETPCKRHALWCKSSAQPDQDGSHLVAGEIIGAQQTADHPDVRLKEADLLPQEHWHRSRHHAAGSSFASSAAQNLRNAAVHSRAAACDAKPTHRGRGEGQVGGDPVAAAVKLVLEAHDPQRGQAVQQRGPHARKAVLALPLLRQQLVPAPCVPLVPAAGDRTVLSRTSAGRQLLKGGLMLPESCTGPS